MLTFRDPATLLDERDPDEDAPPPHAYVTLDPEAALALSEGDLTPISEHDADRSPEYKPTQRAFVSPWVERALSHTLPGKDLTHTFPMGSCSSCKGRRSSRWSTLS